jgi:acetoin utilization protein AcuB
MKGRRIRHMPVTRAGLLLGIVSDRDVLLAASTNDAGDVVVPAIPVGAVMTPSPITCEPSTSVADLARIMTERKIDAVPVLGPSGRLVGLVTSTDLLLLLIGQDAARPLPFEFEVEEGATGAMA